MKATLIMTLLLGPAAGALAATGPVADVVTLRDGTSVLGEYGEAARRPAILLVRRAWVREHAPDWAKRWEAAERIATARAAAQRRDRLTAWRRDRSSALVAAAGGGTDEITPWLQRELALLGPDTGATTAPLMSLQLNSSDVKKVVRHPRAADGLLRQAWLARVRNPEVLSIDILSGELEGRGIDLSRRSVPSVDRLLPPQLETDAAWLARRGATEALYDPGLKFLSYQGMVLPDTGLGGPPGLEALPALSGLMAGGAGAGVDPLRAQLQLIGTRGKVGALVTRLELAPDMSMAAVEVTLWLRQPGDRWAPGGSRSARVRPEELGPHAGKDLENDPQVALALRLVEAVGLQEVSPEVKRRALSMGAATQKALGQARAIAQAELSALALPVLERPDDAGKPASEPEKTPAPSPVPSLGP